MPSDRSEVEETGIEQLGDDWMDTVFLYRCNECGVIYDDGSDVIRHISSEHLPWINWPWKDTSGTLTEKYTLIEVHDYEVIAEYGG